MTEAKKPDPCRWCRASDGWIPGKTRSGDTVMIPCQCDLGTYWRARHYLPADRDELSRWARLTVDRLRREADADATTNRTVNPKKLDWSVLRQSIKSCERAS